MDHFLNDEILIYQELKDPELYVDGVTRLATLIPSISPETEIPMITVQFVSSLVGDMITEEQYISVEVKDIISIRKIRNFENKFYIDQNSKEITRFFADPKNKKDPLTSVSYTSLGSGIVGKYEKPTIPTKTKYSAVMVENPYFLQDDEHSNSFSLASYYTNVYLENVILLTTKNSEVKEYLRENPIDSICVLWKIVLYRTKHYIEKQNLYNLFELYISDFQNSDEPMELPCNYIMKFLGFRGVIGADERTNRWENGCISFDFHNLPKKVSKVRY